MKTIPFDLALVIPSFNEAEQIQATLLRLFEHFALPLWSGKRICLVVVDDGSADETSSRAASMIAKAPANISLQVIKHPKNQGKGAAVRTGIMAADALAYGFTDADLSFDPSLIPVAYEKLAEFEAVFGERIREHSGYSKTRGMISRLLRRFAAVMTGIRAPDPQCGFKFFRRSVVNEVFPKLEKTRFAFDLELVLEIEKYGCRVTSMPVHFAHRAASTVRFRDGLRYLLDVLSVHDQAVVKPRTFLMILGTVAAVLSFAIFGWTIFRGSLFSDDFTWVWFGKQIFEQPNLFFKLESGPFFSAVMNAYYTAFYSIFGYSAPWLFFVNIIVHATASFLTGILIFQLCRSRIAAYIGVMVFATAGGAYEPLVWIAANMHSFATMFMLVTLVAYQQFLATSRLRYLTISFFTFIFALATKEISAVLPAMLLVLLVYRWLQKETITRTRPHIIYAVLISLVFIAYSIFEFIQITSKAATTGLGGWHLSFLTFAKLPIVILDLLLPVKFIYPYLTNYTAVIVTLAAIIIFTLVLRAYRSLPIVITAFILMILGTLPTLFFQSAAWFEPLASRYTYLPRLGAVILVAALIAHHIKKNTSASVISAFAVVLVLVTALQVGYMGYVVSTEYGYVYKTGRTLAIAAALLVDDVPNRVIVDSIHPFSGNNAHILGALNVIGHVPVDHVVFLAPDQNDIPRESGDMLLYWNPEARQYELTSHVYPYPR